MVKSGYVLNSFYNIDDNNSKVDITIHPVYFLRESLERYGVVAEDAEYLVCYQKDYAKLCLEYENNKPDRDLVSYGAFYVAKTNFYNDPIDAKIQAVFICLKYRVPVNRVFEYTHGEVTSQQYTKLSEYIIAEFPEKVF